MNKYLDYILLFVLFGFILAFSPHLHAEECTTNNHVIKNLERRFVKKIIKIWHKEGTHAELDKFELEKVAKKLAKQVVKDNFVCLK